MAELIFVYNARSGIFASVIDLIHKSVSAKTYGCKLCALTYNGISLSRPWKEFVESLRVKAVFLHKDEFVRKYPDYAATSYPVVFKNDGSSLKEIISAGELNQLQDLSGLKALVIKTLRSPLYLQDIPQIAG